MILPPDVQKAEVPPKPALEHADVDGSSMQTDERLTEHAKAPDPTDWGQSDGVSLPVSPVRTRRKAARIAALGVLLIVIGLVVVMSLVPSALQQQAQQEVQSPLVGKPTPPLVGTTITGARFWLADLRGQFVFVDFFASWCAACVASQPQLDAFVRAHAYPGGARLVGVIFGDSVDNVLRFLGPEVGKYPVIPDPGTIAVNWAVYNPAEIYLVEPQGKVVAKIDGAVTAKGLDLLLSRAKLAGG